MNQQRSEKDQEIDLEAFNCATTKQVIENINKIFDLDITKNKKKDLVKNILQSNRLLNIAVVNNLKFLEIINKIIVNYSTDFQNELKAALSLLIDLVYSKNDLAEKASFSLFLVFKKTNLLSIEQLAQLIQSNWANELFRIWSKQIEIDRDRFEKKIDQNLSILSIKLPELKFKDILKEDESNLNDEFKKIISKKLGKEYFLKQTTKLTKT